jgi:hypothetical protein
MTEPCRTIREIYRLLGKKTEILKEALEDATSQKQLRPPPSLPKDDSRRRPSQS